MMLKYWRVWLLVVMVFASVMAIGFKTYPYGRDAVEIVYVSNDSSARGILEQGMFITNINGEKIPDIGTWNLITSGIRDRNVTLRVNGKNYEFYVNETMGIDAIDIERTNLNFGLDLRGGTRIILKPKENATKETMDQVISTLQTRANIYGLREMNFFSIRGADGDYYLQIEVAGIKRDIIDELLSAQGRFEAKISKPVEISGGSGTIQLVSESFPVTMAGNDTIMIGGMAYEQGDSFTLGGIEFEYVNATDTRLFLMGKAYDGDDIELIYSDPQRSGIMPIQGGYRFFFGVLVSPEGAQRFADITSGVQSYLDLVGGERYLESEIFLYLDEQLVSSLRISSDLGGRIVQEPQITGSRVEQEDAIQEKLRLQAILRSGELPTSLETVSVGVISPALGEEFFNSTLYAALFAAGAVIIIIFVRYRSLRISIPMVFIGLSEVVIILGISAANDAMIWLVALLINFLIVSISWWKKFEIDIYAWIGAILIPLLGMATWTIDLPAIGGIIAAIGTGVDHQIIIADETLSRRSGDKRDYTVREKIKRAFFIIFGAAATTIAAMIPLMSIGIGFVRGFAITTIVGVLAGILVTRPAYARIIEAMNKE